MTFRDPPQLAALVFSLVLGLCLSLSLASPSFAQNQLAQDQLTQDQAPPAADQSDEAAMVPACDGTAKPPILEECSPNSGDTAWMLASTAIVLMMTLPGLALFYGGMVRKKNVGDTVMTSFAVTCLISILWLLFTYSLAFRSGNPFLGGLDREGLQGIFSDIASNKGTPNQLAPTIPESVYAMFQLTFAIITAALVCGAVAERMKFSALLCFIGLWAVFVYSPIAHWVWGPDGFLNSGNDAALVKVLDFAGGTQADLDRHLLGCGGRPCRHHAGLRLRRPARRLLHRDRGGPRLLLGLQQPQALLRV